MYVHVCVCVGGGGGRNEGGPNQAFGHICTFVVVLFLYRWPGREMVQGIGCFSVHHGRDREKEANPDRRRVKERVKDK